MDQKPKIIDISLFFKLFFENTITSITILDADFNVITHNKNSDISNQNIITIDWWNTSLQEKNKLIKHLDICKSLRKETSFEAIHYINNEKRYFKTIISPIILDNKLYSIKIEELDITDIKKTLIERDDLLQQLTQSQRLESVGILSGGIAHDFNNILHIILNNLHLLNNNDINDKDKLVNIENIINKGKYLIKQLLFFSRNVKTDKKIINVNDEIHNVILMMNRLIPKDVKFNLDLQSDLYNVIFDKGQLEQIFINLINNSLDALKEDGQITIKTRNIHIKNKFFFDVYENKEYICIYFIDNGTGIDKSILHKIFDPFFTTKPIDKGTGLGLASTYGIVKEHNGKISCYSIKDKITMFKLYLPITKDDITKTKDNEVIRKKNLIKKILLVDDEEDISTSVKELLEINDYNVMVANDGLSSIELMKEHNDISLVILDLNMPYMSGEQTLIELRKINPDINVIISTGYLTTDINNRYDVDIILKPYDIQELIKKIEGINNGN